MSADFVTFSHLLESTPLSDWINLLLLSGVIFIIIIIAELIRRRFHWKQETTRKLVHISVGFILLFTPLLLKTSLPLVVIAVFFTIFNYIALRKNLLPGIHIDRNNYGTVYYAFSFLVLVLLFWQSHKIIIIAAMLTMAVGDAAAAITGHSVKKPHIYTLIRDQKSVEGSLAMFLVSLISIFITFLFYPSFTGSEYYNLSYLLFIAVLASIIATAAEALGHSGNDNLSVPLLTGIVLYFLLTNNTYFVYHFAAGMALGGLVSFFSYRIKFLTASGAITTFVLASIIFGFGGIKWTVPILTFFVLSSILSKLGKSIKSQFNLIFEKGSRRDHLQVLANGGMAGFLMIVYILYPKPEIYFYYLGALAAAMADTWATEIGIMVGQTPRLITNFKEVAAGTSGGVTIAGFIGGFLGASFLSFSGIWFLPENYLLHHVPVIFFTVIMGGLLGCIIDSYLGATVQVQYQCGGCGKTTEKRIHCKNSSTTVITGITWVNNDLVNFINTVFGSLLVYLILVLIL